MLDVLCTKCNNSLYLDEKLTMQKYLEDMDYLVDNKGQIKEETLQSYLVYRCPRCNNTEKLTYRRWELLFRKNLAMKVMEIRKRQMFTEIDPRTVSEDSGLSYCGQCSGYDEEGNCLNDIIKQCTIRK